MGEDLTMTLGYDVEVDKMQKEIWVSDNLYHKIDVQNSRILDLTPNWFHIWIKKDELNNYLKNKEMQGFKINKQESKNDN
jgi:hypothetical protein